MESRGRRAELRALLNEWDPIGVADLVDDEYDCLEWPLLSRLTAGCTVADLRSFLRHELVDHFGLDPKGADVGRVAHRLMALNESW